MAFSTPLDIAKRACQYVGQMPISSFSDGSRQATEINTAYDQRRLYELGANTWGFSSRRVRTRAISSTSQIWTPPSWVSGTTYTIGQVVSATAATYANSALYNWICVVPSDVNNNPELSSNWSHYWGNLMVDVWDNGTNYAAGEIALLPPLYNAGTTYSINNIIRDSNGVFWVSLVNSNTGNTPSSSPTFWTAWVYPSSGLTTTTPVISFQSAPGIYLSLVNNNGPVSQNPPTLPSASTNWTSVGGTVQQLTLLWPTNSGPINDPNTMNVYRLPSGWLRPAVSQANKNSAHPWLGALYGQRSNDFVFHGKYFTSWAAGPIDLDFIADIADVNEFHPLFCEALAASIAEVIDTPLTQNKNVQTIARAYADNIGHAKRIDAVIQAEHTQEMEELVRVRF